MKPEGEKPQNQNWDYVVDVIIVGFGGAGGCAAIEAYEQGASVLILEKQPEDRHYSNTRMSGGGFHSPDPLGNEQALKEYTKAMFSGENLPWKLEGEQPDWSNELVEVWAKYVVENEQFMKNLDPDFKTVYAGGALYHQFPGAEASNYRVLDSSYSGKRINFSKYHSTKDLPKYRKEAGEAFFACISHGIKARSIKIHYHTPANELVISNQGEVIGVIANRYGKEIKYMARKGVVLTSGGYEYNLNMRRAFLEGPGVEGWAFHSSPENTGDGIEMALKVGAGLSKISKAAGGLIAAVPIRINGLKVGLPIPSIGKPHEIIVDNYGRRYTSERKITKNPSRYIFYKEAVSFDSEEFIYPRLPSWLIFDEQFMQSGPIVRKAFTEYVDLPWSEDNLDAVKRGWILKGKTIDDLSEKIKMHPENRHLMTAQTLANTIHTFNSYCNLGVDQEFNRDSNSLGRIEKPPFYALPLYAGGPNTKGGITANAKRQVLNWKEQPIPRLYTAGEISSVFQFAYQGGGNLAECIVFGRVAGKNVAYEQTWDF